MSPSPGRSRKQAAGRFSSARIYTALDRLEQNGLVTSAMGDPTPERGGRAKRFFKVTAKGLRAIKDAQRALTALWTGIPQLKGRSA